MITALSVTLNQAFFCPYEVDSEIITATVTGVGSSGDAVTVTLVRKTLGADFVLATQAATLAGSPLQAVVNFDLTALKNTDGVTLVRSSVRMDDYRVIATAGNVQGRRALTILPLTPKKLRQLFLFGMPLTAAEVFLPGTTTPVKMDDEVIAGHILTEANALAAALQIDLEPTIILSPKLVTAESAYDKLGAPGNYYPPIDASRWMTATLPWRRILKINELSGWINQDKVMTFNEDWRVTTEMGGLVTLVPSSGALIAWQGFGFAHHLLLARQGSIPAFWQYSILEGLPSIPDELVHFIAKRTAIAILNIAGNAHYPAGTVSHSISRDDVSETTGLNPKGAYSALVSQYQRETGLDDKGNETMISGLRTRYGGVLMAIV